MTTAVIVQARTGSSRLPGKVLKPLGGRPVIEHVLSRAQLAKQVDKVCLATTEMVSDDPVAAVAKDLGYAVFRGSVDDVLSRYAATAAMAGAKLIVRITGDCPLIDPAVIDRLIELRADKNADYASNGLTGIDWPHGLDCEIFTREMLDAAVASTENTYDREHVTPWIRTRGAKSKVHLPGPGAPASEERWVLDYPEDYSFLTKLFALFPEEPPLSWESILEISAKHPELAVINAHLRRTALPK